MGIDLAALEVFVSGMTTSIGADCPSHIHTSDRDRSNHTGTQLSTTISDFDQAVDDRLAALPSGSGQLEVPFHADGSANITMTNQANSEQFLGNSNRNIKKVDLTGYTQVRLLARVVTGSASANTPRIYAQYWTSFTTTAATFVDIGEAAVNCSLATAGLIDSGWVDLVVGAKADVFVTVLQNGGDAAADPAVGHVVLQFK